ncbi:MAG: insulinase family protein, partial [Lachnospirales bacterium]
MKTVNIKKGVNLRLIEGEKFGYTTLSILFRQMANKDKATSNSLLSLMFLSGSSKYKNRRLIEIAFEELEGAVIDTNVIKKGNEHIIQIYAKFKKEYTLEIFDILNDIIFKPLFKNEHIEKRILKNLILSQINNKRQYAFNSFLEKNYGDINGDGYIDMIDEVDIFKEYKFLIENSIVEIMAVGGNYDLILEGVKKFPFSQRRIDTIPLKKLQPVKKEYIEESNVIQAKLCVGIDCDFGCKGE